MNFISIANKIGEKARRESKKILKGFEDINDENKRILAEEWYKAKYRELVKNLDSDLTLAFEDNGLVDVLNKHGFPIKKNEMKLTGKWFFITLRPENKHEHRFIEFKPQVEEYLKRSMFEEWLAVYEQKGENIETLGKGFHVHIVAKCADWATKKKMINDTKSTWKKWLGGDVPDAFVQIDKIETEQHRSQLLDNYMIGNKKDEWKKPAVLMDKAFRLMHKLDDSYKSKGWKV